MIAMADHKAHIFILTAYKKSPLWTLIVFIAAMLIMLILQHNYYNSTYDERDLKAFEKVLHTKEKQLQHIFGELAERSKNEDPMNVLEDQSLKLRDIAEKKGIYIYYFNNGRLSYWTDHTVSIKNRWLPRMSNPVYQDANGTYVTSTLELENNIYIGLILIKKEYPFENEYLANEFVKDFHLSPEIELSTQSGPGLSDVYNLKENYLFSLDLSSVLKKNTSNITVATLLFMLAIVALFGFLSIRTDSMESAQKRTRWLTISALIMLVLSVTTIRFEFPRIVFDSNLFKPDVYASLKFASLGHLWLFISLVFMITLLFYWFFDRSRKLADNYRTALAVVLIISASLWFIIAHSIGSSLVMDSTISFAAYKLNSLSINTFIGLLILLLAYAIYCLLFDKALQMFNLPPAKREYLIIFFSGLPILIIVGIIHLWNIDLLTLVFYVFISGSIVFLRSSTAKMKFSRFFPLLLLISVFLTIDLQEHTSDKLNSRKEIELAKLSSEHDAVAEMLFPELYDSLRSDSNLINRLSYQIIDIDLMFDYLQRTHFSGYWTKYDLKIAVCRSLDSIQIETPEVQWVPCYPFFEYLIADEGIAIENSDFYYLNNLNGRISYLGKILYQTITGEITLFIELNSRIISEELGYPSLLLSEKDETDKLFSYAKYNQGILVTSSGNFNYRRSADYYTDRKSTFENIKSDGFDHTIFNVDPQNTVIVSIRIVSLLDRLISFSYYFALIFILFTISYFIISASHIKATVTWDFKNKIQYSVIGILFLTFLVICSGTIYFVIEQYRLKHEDNLQNTMRSLYIELIHKVEYEEDLRHWSSESYYNLDELLRKFSNVFNTDINMYDKYGMLLATSRNEIFDQQLLSYRMDREAFEKLSLENYSRFIHTEKIGKMAYQSAYVPILNNENSLLAYLNLPYFTEPEILAQEVTNLVVAIVNTYVILLLLILFLSVFLADRITQPLRFIQSRIAQLSLSKKNEKIVYKGRDEIAGLVDEYNYMVDELVKSAELLAQSERETAWREMAKQIAHEIKNPLTPMKLNVQHMLRMISEDSTNIKEQIEKVSQNLIEQIDLLTSIANGFSDFAKMPKAKNRKIDILKILQKVVDLFVNSEGVHIELEHDTEAKLISYGDPEQFQRVIINLVKNGIQSIPENREKQIIIRLEEAPGSTAIITVSDNGKGIPPAIQDKLFQPNFTTKSSGMGMGLAISSNIIRSMSGNIWYSTREDEGTKFFIKVPLVE